MLTTHPFPHIDQQTIVETECIADVWVAKVVGG